MPIGEAARLANLYASELLDTEHDGAFDAIARLAALVTDAPVALITLVDEHRQHAKACVGIASGDLERRDAFCAYAILDPDRTLLVPDATLDERFRDNPHVIGDDHVRFYCGAPIVTATGHALGTVCVVDHVPRQLDDAHVRALEDLAHQASLLIQSRMRIRQLEETTSRDEVAHVAALQAVSELTASATDLDAILASGLDAIIETLELSAGGLWWHDGEQLAVDPLWIDGTGLLGGAERARRDLAYPADLLVHTRETATRHGDDVLPTLVAAAFSTAGIRASFIVPIIVGETIVGAYELVPNMAGEPSPRRLLAATQAAAEIGRWVERDRSPSWVHATTTPAPHEPMPVQAGLLRRHGALKARLAGAVERSELSVAYEPIMCLDTDAPIAVEALARWHDATLGDVSPGEFIPLAEESGAIRDIGAFVRRQALRDLAGLARSHADPARFALWLNVSTHELDAHFATAVLEDLADAGVDPRNLVLEVTERQALTGDDPSAEPLFQLAAHGIGIAIDDFGTGFTSLTQLRSMPLTHLKIDRSFIADLAAEQAARICPIVAGIVQLGHSLGLRIVTEGVETRQQAAVVRELGADFAQGYLYR